MNELPLNQILCGDCVNVLKDFPDNSIDLVVTDPPYGLSFMGKEWDKTLPPREAFEEIIRVLKPGALTFVNSSPRQDLFSRMIQLLEKVGFKTDVSFIEWIYKTGFPKAYDISLGIDRKFIIKEFLEENGRKPTKDELKELIKEKRKIIDINPSSRPNSKKYGGGGFDNLKGVGSAGIQYLTDPWHPLAKDWDGWKAHTGLKPAQEPIIMVYKPLSKSTIVDNILRWGTGAINVEACRIPFIQGEEVVPFQYKTKPDGYGYKDRSNEDRTINQKGRFPANLLVSNKALDTGKLSKSGTLEAHHEINSSKTRNIYGEYKDQPPEEHITYGDIGDQSRYFDLDAWARHHGFLDVPKPDNKERDFGIKGRNAHPTVKPIKLMAYLIELGCPPDGVVLDPFLGSGTTCIAAKQLVRKYIGIEINPKYHALAKSRIEAYPVPLSWFSEEIAFFTNKEGSS